MATIHKKVLREYFEKIITGKKKLELRLADFEVNEGDFWFWKNGIKTKKNTREEKLRLSPPTFSKPKTKLFGRQRKLKNTDFKLSNLNQNKIIYANSKSKRKAK